MGVGRLTRVSASDTHPPQRDEDVQALPRVLPSQEVEVRRVAAEPGREPPPAPTHARFALAPAVESQDVWRAGPGGPGASLRPALALVRPWPCSQPPPPDRILTSTCRRGHHGQLLGGLAPPALSELAFQVLARPEVQARLLGAEWTLRQQ